MLILLTLVTYIHSKCIVKSNCKYVGSQIECEAPSIEESDPQPQMIQNFACPHMDQSNLCCNQIQSDQMNSNFALIDRTFGSGNQGCDFCASNIKRMWCEYTCTPDQDKYVKNLDYVIVQDPADKTRKIRALKQKLTLSSKKTCDIFNTCKRTPFVAQVSAMSTAVGFVKFQGKNGVEKAKILFDIDFDKDGLDFGVVPCNSKKDKDGKDKYGFKINQECSCNNCEDMCENVEFKFPETKTFEGFNGLLIGIVYGLLFLITLIQYARQKY